MSNRTPLFDETEHAILDRAEHELQVMLSVEPSPALVRRVRERTNALQPQHPLWWWAWAVPVSAGLVVALLVGRLVTLPTLPDQPVDGRITQPARAPVEEATVPVDGGTSRKPTQLRNSAQRRIVREPDRMEVSVPPGERVAWQQFIAFAGRGPIGVQMTTISDSSPVDPLQIEALEFEPLSVEP